MGWRGTHNGYIFRKLDLNGRTDGYVVICRNRRIVYYIFRILYLNWRTIGCVVICRNCLIVYRGNVMGIVILILGRIWLVVACRRRILGRIWLVGTCWRGSWRACRGMLGNIIVPWFWITWVLYCWGCRGG